MASTQTRAVAFTLAGFSVMSAVLFHADFADQNQMNSFMKNIAIAGGFLFLMANGPGAYALDNRAAKPTAAHVPHRVIQFLLTPVLPARHTLTLIIHLVGSVCSSWQIHDLTSRLSWPKRRTSEAHRHHVAAVAAAIVAKPVVHFLQTTADRRRRVAIDLFNRW